MKKLFCVFSMMALMMGSAFAGTPYAGITLGAMNASDTGGVNFDGATNAGLLAGYDFGGSDVRLGLEGEYTTTVSDGDFVYQGTAGEWDVDTYALFGTVRMGGKYYVKGRAGMVHEKVSASVLGVSFDGDDTGFGGGLGIGLDITDSVDIEANWTYVEQDLDAWSLGVIAKF